MVLHLPSLNRRILPCRSRNLPSDYPMVAPNYSKARSALAKSAGLGRKPAEKPKGRGRKKKAA
jgi:predicted transcriptional regulator